MNRITIAAVVFLLAAGFSTQAYPAGTPDQAQAMVKKAIQYYHAKGKEKTFAEINNTKGLFTRGDLYVTVYDMEGNCVANGFDKKLIGRNLIGWKDPDGVPFIKERIDLVKAKKSGWQKYKYTNPVTRKIELKTAYVERADDFVFMCGAYIK